jgi:hypothetical protein
MFNHCLSLVFSRPKPTSRVLHPKTSPTPHASHSLLMISEMRPPTCLVRDTHKQPPYSWFLNRTLHISSKSPSSMGGHNSASCILCHAAFYDTLANMLPCSILDENTPTRTHTHTTHHTPHTTHHTPHTHTHTQDGERMESGWRVENTPLYL